VWCRPLQALALSLVALAPSALALDEVVSKRVLRVQNFQFVSGETIPELRLGFETYGRLNPRRDNAVLICHFFAGDSHAAGRYSASASREGWWNELIGPGLPIDTDRYYVVCTDLPVGMMAKRDTVVTTGPRTVDPRTGEAYGADFPRTFFHDMVAAQRLVLNHLGVRRLRLVTGPSMGGMLALQWAVSRPSDMDLVLAVSAPISFTYEQRFGFQSAGWAIRSDPLWLGGDYLKYGVEPHDGIALALHGLSALEAGEAYLLPWRWLSFREDAKRFDANTYLQTIDMHTAYTLGAEYGSQEVGLRRIRSRVVLLGSSDDPFITPEQLEEAEQALNAAGVRVERRTFAGENGHLSCLEDQDEMAPALRAILR